MYSWRGRVEADDAAVERFVELEVLLLPALHVHPHRRSRRGEAPNVVRLNFLSPFLSMGLTRVQ